MSSSHINKAAASAVSDEPLTLESLKTQVDKLINQVMKNTNAIITTGKQVLDIQIQHERGSLVREARDVASIKSKGKDVKPEAVTEDKDRQPILGTFSSSYRDSKLRMDDNSDVSDEDEGGKGNIRGTTAQEGGDGSSSDIITSEDVVELVTELQGQLDILDERSIRRTANAFVSDDSDVIAPLPGRDGEIPVEEEGFPHNLRQFKDQDSSQVEQWLKWYELIPPDEDELHQILDRAGATLEDIGLTEPVPKKADITPEVADTNFDLLARFLGLRIRRTKGVW